MSAEECTHADWYALGQADGAKGRDRQYLQERISDCAKAQVAADTGRYAQGYAQGLQQYCVVENAFSLGANGGQYKGVCPAAIDPQFRRRFDAGRAIYDTRQEVKRLQERINDKERELTQTHKDEERKLRDPKNADERRRIQRDFEQRRHRLRSEIEQLDRQLYRARDQQYDAERRPTTPIASTADKKRVSGTKAPETLFLSARTALVLIPQHPARRAGVSRAGWAFRWVLELFPARQHPVATI